VRAALLLVAALAGCHSGEKCVRSHTECGYSCVCVGSVPVGSAFPVEVCDEWAASR
jgi:hypothetical protein